MVKKNRNCSVCLPPIGWYFKKHMNPSWSFEKPSLASKILEIPTNRLFHGDSYKNGE